MHQANVQVLTAAICMQQQQQSGVPDDKQVAKMRRRVRGVIALIVVLILSIVATWMVYGSVIDGGDIGVGVRIIFSCCGCVPNSRVPPMWWPCH